MRINAIPAGKYSRWDFFFTVVTHKRRNILCEKENVSLLRDAFRCVKEKYPFEIDAFVLLPDHFHCIWKLPKGDSDFSTRMRLVKSYFTRRCVKTFNVEISGSRKAKNEQDVWQRRFWEHHIRDEDDYNPHVNYIHYNPVKHDYVKSPNEWEYSSFLRFVNHGKYKLNWNIAEDSQIYINDDYE